MHHFYFSKSAAETQAILNKLDAAVKCDDCNAQTVLPVQTVQNCNLGKCTISMNNPNGLGLDRANTY